MVPGFSLTETALAAWLWSSRVGLPSAVADILWLLIPAL